METEEQAFKLYLQYWIALGKTILKDEFALQRNIVVSH